MCHQKINGVDYYLMTSFTKYFRYNKKDNSHLRQGYNAAVVQITT